MRDHPQGELTGLWGWGRAEYGRVVRPPGTYTVQLALPPQVVRVGQLLEGVLEVDSYQGS